jgi:prepilin-type N-terminal cleavage/methylation domain-containing protein
MVNGQRHSVARCAARQPRGFTIVELVVAISVIGLLMALLIPAVQSAREAGRRVECLNHLRQFGIAIQSFESTHRAYPRWRGPLIEDPGTPQLDYRNHSVHAQLLPYLEQPALADDPLFDGGVGPSWEPRIRSAPENTRVAVFFCPSDDGAFGTNYRACTGSDIREWHLEGYYHRAGGVFGRREATRPQDVTDGTSQTVMMSEKRISDIGSDYDPRTDYWYTGLDVLLPNDGADVTADEMLAHCSASSGSPAAYFPWAGLEWHPATFNATFYNHVAPPNSPIPDCSIEGSPPNAGPNPGNEFQTRGSFGASSAHPQSVNALLADGAVRSVADHIDKTVWRALATIAGHEVTAF